jgi:hypothetical protein
MIYVFEFTESASCKGDISADTCKHCTDSYSD